MAPMCQQVGDAAVERVLDRFKNDLWIQRRLTLDEVIESLKLESKNYEDRHRDKQTNPTAEILLDYIGFVEFLKDQCSGQHFTSDKQWGHLLNLMSVSRKVNHLSAKFSDIIKSKYHIETNFQDIRNFNESVKQASIINDTLKDLERNLDLCQLIIEFSEKPTEVDQHSMLIDVSKAIRHLENTSGPIMCNLRVQLYSRSIDPMFERERQTWRENFSRLESIFDSLYQFLNQYFEFLKNFSELHPLLLSLDGLVEKSSDHTRPVQKDATLQSLLTSCKAEFNKVINFDQKLTEFLRAQIKQKPSAPESSKQQVQALQIVKLIDSKLRFKDEILTVTLQEANKIIRSCDDTLGHIKRSLRLEFGRFYFLNDLELLSLIALDVRLVADCDRAAQRRLIRKIFNNSIDGFTLGDTKEGARLITGITNSIGEEIELAESSWIPLKKRVNIYSLEVVRILNDVLRKLRRSLSSILQDSIHSWSSQSRFDLQSPTNDIDWSLPVQLLDLFEHVKFTKRVESKLCLDSPELQSMIEFYEAKLHGLRSMSDVGDCGVNAISMLKVSAAVSITVHFIDLLINLNESAICSADDWNWKKLPRFYAKQSTSKTEWQLEVQIATATFVYRFDLLPIETEPELDGNSQRSIMSVKRLISTATSERCFLAASQAITQLKSGASPCGPAGSGKTETVKALGHLLGCQVIVHNCDESNDSESLERLIWGLAHTGLWGCFDEFNRLSSSTLSSVSSVLELVQASLRSSSLTIELDGCEIKCIDPDSAFFVTLNPGDGSKYRGRRRLPANLRSLFLPVAMFQVQIEAIIRQMLLIHSSGSSHLNAAISSDLARRFSRWIQSGCNDLTSTRSNRCEFDLRLVLAVLKRFFRLLSEGSGGASRPTMQLHDLMVTSIQAEVCPRLEGAQVYAFEETLSVCFGTTASSSKQERKIQLKTQLEGRSGVILLGDKQTGKSTSWRTLLDELNENSTTICCSTLNPKAYNKDRLFGYFETGSAKWADGIFTRLVRQATTRLHNESGLQQAWIVLDGDIDPDWIECLNSVLDDNQVLTLSSGERINFVISPKKCIKLIFETDSIQYASPATISRLGLVYFEEHISDQYVKKDSLDLMIFYGGADSHARLDEAKSIVGHEQRSVTYSCNENCNAESLVELMQLSADSDCTYIIQNLDLIREEDKWGSRTFVGLLRYMITYKQYYDKDWNLIKLSEGTRFSITAESLDGIIHQRLLAMAKTREVSEDVRAMDIPSYETLDVFVKEKLLSDLEPSSILVLQNEQALKMKRAVILSIQTNYPANVDLRMFNNEATSTQSIEKLEKLAKLKNAGSANDDRKCIFLIESLDIYLMDKENKRKLYDLVNSLSIKNLISSNTRILVVLDNLQKLDTSFWSSIGQSCTIATEDPSTNRLQDLLEQKLGSKKELHHLEWLSQEAAKIVSKKEVIAQDQFIGVLVEMIAAMRDGLRNRTRMLRIGLDKLREFEAQIEEIKSRRQEEDLALREQKLATERLMEQIDLEIEKSGTKKLEIERLQVELIEKSATLETQTSKIQSELNVVLPMIESSKREVSKCLKPETLNEIKTLRAPPKTIKDILDVLFVFLDVQDTSWAAVKAYLTRVSLRDELTNYDFAKRLDNARLEKVKHEIGLRRDSFQTQQAKRASSAILPIFNWIKAALEYGNMCVKLKPLTGARDRLKSEAQQLTASMSQLEKDRKQLEEKVSEDRNLLKTYQANYSDAISVAEKMAAELAGARKIIGNSEKQVLSWHERLSKLEALSASEEGLYRVCLVCAATTIWAEDLEKVSALLRTFNHKLTNNNQLEIFIMLARDHVNILLDSIGEESIETSTVKLEELNTLLQLLRLKLCLRFKAQSSPRLPFIKFDGSIPKADGRLAAVLSAQNLVCSNDELLVVRHHKRNPGSWRQSFDMGLKMNRLLAIHLHRPDLDVVDAILEHHQGTSIILFGELAQEMEVGNPLNQLFHTFSFGQHANKEEGLLADRIGNLLLQQCEPKIGAEVSRLESSLRLKQREQTSLEASLLKKLNQSSADKNIQSLYATGLKSDLVRALNELQKASESLRANIDEIKDKLSDFRSRQTEYTELSAKVAKFYTQFLSPLQERGDFYAFTVGTLVDLLLLSSSSGEKREEPRVAFGMAQLEAILTRAMCSQRPECRLGFRDHLLASSSELARLVDGSDVGGIAKLVENCRKASADLCHNLINLLTVDKNLEVKQSALTTSHRDSNFELVVIVHDERKPSPQVVVDELFKRGTSAFVAKDNDFHYQKVYARSERRAAAGEGHEPLEAHLRRLMMPSTSSSASATSNNQKSRTQARIQTKCICIANAHLAARWINMQLLDMLKETCRDAIDERYVFLLICESSERQSGSTSSDKAQEPSHELDLNLLEAATLKFWYDELALNALDRYNLYLGPLQDAHGPSARRLSNQTRAGHKSIAPVQEFASESVSSTKKGWRKRCELIEDLVMFHVVCQELIRLRRLSAKCQVGSLALWQKADYNFDYEQLSLALKIWNQIQVDSDRLESERADERGTRKLFCHLLESIVYGSRLECEEDEELLKFLLNCFMQIPSEPLSETVRRKRLVALELLAQHDDDLTTKTTTATSVDGISSTDNESATARYASDLARLIRVRE